MGRKLAAAWIVMLSMACLWKAVGCAEPICAAAGEQQETNRYRAISAYLQSCAENAHIPSLSVTIVDKDSVLFSQSYGGCESCDTPFFLGSVSKSFTAVCIMQLAERGKLDLDAPISAYLPDAADGGSITVSQLLNHTSGLGEHQTLGNYKRVNEQGVHHYANVNYSLLGKIIEAASGKPYSDYIAEHLFEPLGLSHTAATLHDSVGHGVIDGYINYWGLHVKGIHQYPSSDDAWITVPAGYLSSSTNDLGKYLQMYLDGGKGILSKQSIDRMLYGDTVYVDGGIPYWYGYGWATVKEPFSEPVLRHSGLVETGTSCIFLLPESGIAIAIAANINDYFVTNDMMDSLGWGVVLMLLGNPPNEILGSAYFLRHLWIDLIMLAVFAVAVLLSCLPLTYINRMVNKRKRSGFFLTALFFFVAHLLLPVLILLLVPVCFATPLWVAEAFVPDVFITVAVSAAALFASGLLKGIIWCRRRRKEIL